MSLRPVPATLRREWAADLSTARLYALLRLRVEVFVVEQNCPYRELDGLDLCPTTRHLWVESESADMPLACLRLLEGDDGFRIGRLCTAPTARRRGLARRLIEAALAEVGDAPCELEAQVQAEPVYASFGFRRVGEEYVEDGIPHVRMRRAPTR